MQSSFGSRLSAKLKSQDVFALDGRIRWAGHGNVQGKMFFSEVRLGVTPFLGADRILDLFRIRAEYLTEIGRRTAPFVGRPKYIITAYEPYIEVIVMREDRYLALSVNPDTSLNDLHTIIGQIESLDL